MMGNAIPEHMSRSWAELPNSYLRKMSEKHKSAEWRTVEYSDGGSCGMVKYPGLLMSHGGLKYLFNQNSASKTGVSVSNSETGQLLLLSIYFKGRLVGGEGNIHISLNNGFTEKDLEEILYFMAPESCEIKA